MNLKEPFNLLSLKKTNIGDPPGTLNYQGPYKDIGVQIEVIEYNHEVHSRRKISSLDESIIFFMRL